MTNDELLSWINSMPEWVRKCTMMYYENGQIMDADIKILADMCISGSNDFYVSGVNLINHDIAKGFAIRELSSIEGVNAIDTSKPLTIGENGITVVYGLNGAGKSGYIRIFKMISGAKYREDIKNNIYSSKNKSPKATVELIMEDGSNPKYICDLKKPAQYDELRGIDIFDSKISTAYVNDAKEATYEPWIFSLFSVLATTASKIKIELENRKSKYLVVDCSLPEKYSTTEAYKIIQEVSEKSDPKLFPKDWTEKENSELQSLKEKNQIDTLKDTILKCDTEKENILILKNYFKGFEQFFSDLNWEKILEARDRWKETDEIRKAAEILFIENSEEIDSKSVTLNSWKKLWQYARVYYDEKIAESSTTALGSIGSKCPLCHQVINDIASASRIQSIDAYVSGQVAENEKKAYAYFEQKAQEFPQLKQKEDLEVLINASGMKNSLSLIMKQHDMIVCFSNGLKTNLREMNFLPIDLSGTLDIIESTIDLLKKRKEEAEELLNSDAQKCLEQNILEHEARLQLVGLHETIVSNIANLKEIKKIEAAIKLTATNKITSISKLFAEELITTEYIKRFESELQELTKNTIEVNLVQQKAGKGKVPYKVVLTDVNGKQISPQDVLSEGEMRVTSLAAFFAEAFGRDKNTPLIVDDPISSLDYKYEAKVIDRLVKAASQRQVVVFTHRISMVVGINEGTKKAGIPYKEISLLSNKNKKGVPSEVSNLGGKVKSQLNNLINDRLSKLKKLDEFDDEYQSLLHNICQEFRNIVEKSVEDILINEVVKRFRREIQTKGRLEKLSQITEDDCLLIDRLMSKYSYYDHSMPDETPLQEIEPDELEKDMNDLLTWIRNKS